MKLPSVWWNVNSSLHIDIRFYWIHANSLKVTHFHKGVIWVVKENENWNCGKMPLTTSIWIIRNIPYRFLVNLHIFIVFASWWCFIPHAMSQKLSHAWSLTPSLFFSIDCSVLKTKLPLNPIFLTCSFFCLALFYCLPFNHTMGFHLLNLYSICLKMNTIHSKAFIYLFLFLLYIFIQRIYKVNVYIQIFSWERLIVIAFDIFLYSHVIKTF